jgi:hypothetical protein
MKKKRKMSSPFASMKWHVSDCQFIDSLYPQRQTNKTFPTPPKEKKKPESLRINAASSQWMSRIYTPT